MPATNIAYNQQQQPPHNHQQQHQHSQHHHQPRFSTSFLDQRRLSLTARSLGASWKQFESMEFSLVSPPTYNPVHHPLESLETEFFDDLNCCGLTMTSLHELLTHYEEFHTQDEFDLDDEDDDEDEDMFGFDNGMEEVEYELTEYSMEVVSSHLQRGASNSSATTGLPSISPRTLRQQQQQQQLQMLHRQPQHQFQQQQPLHQNFHRQQNFPKANRTSK